LNYISKRLKDTRYNIKMSLYATLAETSGKKCETWYYFIKYYGNEEMLKSLQKKLDKVDFYIIKNLSTFDLENLVCEKTAKEMSKIEVNVMFHRKFDGELKNIDFRFKKRDDNEDRICKVFEVLGLGRIEEHIDEEDIDEEDMDKLGEYDSDSDDSDSDDSDSDESDGDESDGDESDDDEHSNHVGGVKSKLYAVSDDEIDDDDDSD
jgi:hypothetical protein